MFDAIQDLLSRQWHDLLARPSGPMSFRFLLQPVMAILMATRDGLADARAGRPPYFWRILSDAGQRRGLLREGLSATARIILLGLVMDAIYQFIAFRKFYPFEAIVVALGLAFVPYLLLRGPVARLTNWWHGRHAAAHAPPPK